MPIYDYLCDHCGHAFSAVRSFTDPPVEICPNCGKRPRRLILAPAIVFKGSGWYKTDSRSTRKAAESGAEGDAKPSPGKRAEAKGGDEKKADGTGTGEKGASSGPPAKSEAAS